ncbi:LOW QUALITY PROTEIN: putative F-box/LRR-repeat protein 23 [Phalaenopsis equestris]|uniref:LOW QUALITY PROTEIN: putative F-box/LRR-repeat protein 23 n=1 Tax=Phalaenopsis equestris TaxID=78828 RepID=UPI0009E21BF1|nr:LOW QUALITY PROTEIN: putative F-box/LRR-repeat protein 23 [Phalaenopsis equestris]
MLRQNFAEAQNVAISPTTGRASSYVKNRVIKCHIGEKIINKNDSIYNFDKRATKLRCLRLISMFNMSAMALAQAVRKFPLLEELEISFCFISAELLGSVSLACPQLKSFRLNQHHKLPYDDDYYSDFDENFDAEALAIATHMQQLHRLQLIGNSLTNTGLFSILDNCPNLQHIDIRRCLNITIDENLKKKCKLVKHLRLPNDSTADSEFNEVFDGPITDLAPALFYSYYDRLYGDSDYYDHDGEVSDMDYDDLFDFC